MSDETYLGSETIPGDGLYEKPSFKIFCSCDRCGHEFSYVTKRLSESNRPCPRRVCKTAAHREQIMREARNIAQMLEEQRAPGHIGESITVKAVDETARVVMEDYAMTDLKDNIRVGEAVAPKLPVPMQNAADNFFNGGAVKGRAGIRNEKQAQLMGRRAIAGAFRGMAVHPGQVFTGNQGDSALRLVGKEKLKDG